MTTQGTDNYPRDKFYSLYRVFGYCIKDNFSISSNDINGLITWIAGPYLIFYDIKADKQVSYHKNPNNKIISCVKFSTKGKLFATGEGNCKNSELSIYEIFFDNETHTESHKLFTSFKNHKYGIEKILFFKNDEYLISIGDKEDKNINIFNLIDNTVIYSTKYNRPILSLDICDNYMIQCGDKYIKYFNFEKMFDLSQGKGGISKHYVDMSQLNDKTFISVLISEEQDKKIFFLTFDGFLAEMKSKSLVLGRWMHIKCNHGLSLCLFDRMLGCGCTDGIIRIFKTETLAHVITLHRPPPLGKANIESNAKKINMEVTQDSQFADIISIFYSNYHKKLVTIYSDKTFFVWSLEEMKQFFVYRYNSVHCGSITSMDYQVAPGENLFKMATGSEDRTVILWNLKLNDYVNNSINTKPQHIAYSRYIKHIFYFGNNYNHLKINQDKYLAGSTKDNNGAQDMGDDDQVTSITCVKFSPNQKYLACGDNVGNIYIFSLATYEKIQDISAHNGKVNAIDMLEDIDRKKSYLATGGDDNLLSLINTSGGLESELDIYENSILEKLQSPIVSVLFCVDKNKRIKLLTGETDSTINFYELLNSTLQLIQKFNDATMKTYCLSYCAKINKIISGHNGKITIWKTSTCVAHKHFQVNKGDKQLDNFRIASDSQGLMFATSNNDKIIRIRSLHDGQLLTKIPIAESISSLAFAMNDNYLIATSVEGYIYFYKISSEYVNSLSKDNNLINSTEEKMKINNKLRLLEKLTKNDMNMSKNEQVKYLMSKMQNSEELTYEDMKILDSYFKEEKNKQKSESNDDKRKKEIIELKEDKPNNNDDIENENNEMDNDNQYLTKSKIFEKGLKEMKINSGEHLRKSIRVSLADTYNKNKKNCNLAFSKDIEGQKEDKTQQSIESKLKIPAIKIVVCNQPLTNEKENAEKEILNPFIQPIQPKSNINVANTENNNINPFIQNNNKNESPKAKIDNLTPSKQPTQQVQTKVEEKKPKVIEQFKKTDETTDQINDIQKLIRKTNEFVDKVDTKMKLTEEDNNIEDPFKGKAIKDKDNNIISINDINIGTIDDSKEKEKYSNLSIHNLLINQEKTKIPEEIKEEIEHEDSKSQISHTGTRCEVSDSIVKHDFTPQIEENSRLDALSMYQKSIAFSNTNLIVTKSNFDISSLYKKTLNELTISSAAENVELIFNKPEKLNKKSKATSIEILSKETPSASLIKSINTIDVNKLSESELKIMLQNLEQLRAKINIKLHKISPDPTMELMLEKYSVLLMNKIENSINK